MPKIFISYRRDDSAGHTGRICDHLMAHFGQGQVFMDVDTIKPGLNYVEVVQEEVESCDAFIAVIGMEWLRVSDESALRRLDNPEDLVRQEIATALERDIPVIPVLVQGAQMPRAADLPEDLKELANLNALEVSDARFRSDVERLRQAIEAPTPTRMRRWFIVGAGMAAIVATLLAAAGGIWFAQGGSRGDDGQASAARSPIGDTVAPEANPVAIGLAPATSLTPRSVFRGNLQHTGVYRTEGVPQLNGLKWRFKTEDKVYSSPAIAGGVVYFGSWDGYLYAVEIETGKEKWRFKTDGSVTSSAAIAGGVVYFGSWDGDLYAVEIETGKEKWRFETDGPVTSSPAVASGVIYFGSDDGNLYAVDMETGQERWHFETSFWVRSSPAIADGVVYFGSGDFNLYAVDLRTAQEKWRFQTGDHVVSSPAIADGVVFFGAGDSHLYAIDVETGLEKWKFETGHLVASSPAIADGAVYFGSRDGYLYAVDVQTGEQKWKFKTEDMVRSSPAIARGVAYFGSRDGYLYAVDIETGEQRWNFKTADAVRSVPVIADGVVYFGSYDGHLYAVQ